MVYKKIGSEMKMNNQKNLSMLVALFLILMTASSVVSGDGTDPLDPSDGGADWDGDGLTNAEEQSHGTDMTKVRQRWRRTPRWMGSGPRPQPKQRW